jgi:hypothetical protein
VLDRPHQTTPECVPLRGPHDQGERGTRTATPRRNPRGSVRVLYGFSLPDSATRYRRPPTNSLFPLSEVASCGRTCQPFPGSIPTRFRQLSAQRAHRLQRPAALTLTSAPESIVTNTSGSNTRGSKLGDLPAETRQAVGVAGERVPQDLDGDVTGQPANIEFRR